MKNYFKHKMRGKHPLAIAGLIVLGIAAIAGLAILFGFIIMWLWNWLMPEIFDLPSINYWQAVGLFILLKILIGGCGGGSGSSSSKHSDKKCKDDKKQRNDFSKWAHYDKFWEEEGEAAYENYLEKKEKGDTDTENKPEIE